ncbi:39S ribosomal protein L23, mitochondrial-like [Paramacrobiotus metropolitanus]|uniref:39S ribosomal protein L23, mitochondrial-like n=1 Tax=Paramacrobiotus metropolitanus TaxID=2943436 RepID=UPI0024465510|nr:39S ribosomal protein L23, mitochondrial-like [Paramacrobiotus metropolitanus]
MSNKTYPLWKPGAPQLRIFLPDFLMKLIKPEIPMPKNIVQFEVDLKMSETDVKNYLQKIYKVPVKDVRLRILRGERFRHPVSGSDSEHFKPDKKYAYVTLDRAVRFDWPNLTPEQVEKDQDKELQNYDDAIQKVRVQRQKHWDRSGAPTWFSV